MARILSQDDHVVIGLAWWEKVAARHSHVSVPLAALLRVTVEPDWWRALRGIHQRGICVPGLLCIGTRRHQAGQDFTAVQAGKPVVCIELRPYAPLRLLAVSVRDVAEAEAAAGQLRKAATEIDASTPWRQPLPVPDEGE